MDQSELAGLYEQYLGRAPDESGIATWSGQDTASVIAGITGSQEYQNNQGGGGGGGGGDSGGGGGSPAPTDINAIYQQYLGRGVDPSGAQTYAGWAPQDIINAVTSSPEYASRSGGAGADSTGVTGGANLDALYQQFLGRAPDASGAQTYAGWSTQDVTNAILGSQEYQQSHGGGGSTPSSGNTDINSLYQQYLGRDVDPGGLATWSGQSPDAILAGITGSQEYQNLHPGAPVLGSSNLGGLDATQQAALAALSSGQRNENGLVFVGDENSGRWVNPDEYLTETGLQRVNYLKDPKDYSSNTAYYTDAKTGNTYDASGKLVLGGEAAKDKYLSATGVDPETAQKLYDLKKTDPNKYYEEVATKIADNVYTNYTQNVNYDNAYNQLQSLKDVNPAAYYKAQIDFLAKQAGWQTGQNTSDRAAPVIDQLKQLAAEAQGVGIGADEINKIVGTGYSTANIENQQRIANLAATGGSGFNFSKDVMPGVTFIAVVAASAATAGAASAVGGAILGSAAATVGTVGTAALGGAVIGAGMGALTAAVSNGDIGQGAIRGGISGAIGGAASGAMADMSATASGLVGSETVKDIAAAVNLTKEQVSSIIVNTAATTLAGAATGQVNSDNFAQVLGTALATSAIGQYASDIAYKIDPELSKAALSAVSGVAQVATNTALNGGSVQNAIMRSIPSIIAGSVGTDARDNGAGFNPYATENVGLTSGAVDRTLQQGLIDPYINEADDPIRAFAAQNNLTGNTLDNIRYSTNVMLDQNMPKQDIVDNLAAVYRVDEKTAENYYQNTVANNAFERLAAKAEDPIALINAAKMLTGDKQENLKYIADEMKKQGLPKSEISSNLQDLYKIEKTQADAYTNQILGNKSVVSTADNYADAFKEARAAGAKVFEWNGKQYNTQLAPPPSAKTEEEQKTPMQTLAQAMAPRTRTLQEAIDFAKSTAPMFDTTTKGLGDRLTDPNRAYPETFKKYSETTWEKLNSKLSPYIENPEKVIPEIKETIGKAADFYKDSLLASGGQIINSIGNVRNNVAQIAISQGWIAPENSFVISSQAMQKFGDTMVPSEFRGAQADIVKEIDSVDSVPGKIVAGLVSSLKHPQAASLYVGDALVQAGLPMAAGAAATAFTGLVYTGVAVTSLLNGAQSFGNTYEQVVKDLMNKGMPEVEARDKAMLPSYVSALITTIISPLGNAPIIRAIAGPEGTDIVLRTLSGPTAAGIIEKSMPLFSSAGKDFASGFFDNLFGGMSTELILTGEVTPSKHLTGAVLEGLIEVGTNSTIKAPFAAADALSAAKQQQSQQQQQTQQQQAPQQQDVELKEYKIPLLGYDNGQQNAAIQLPYTPNSEVKAIGYSPVSSDSAATMIDTRDNAASTLSNALGIDLETATQMATDTIGAAAIDVLNSESSPNTPKIDANKVIAEDAFGTPITFAKAIGSITTDTPIIDLEIGTQEQQISNANILQSIFSTLNIDPQSVSTFEPQRQFSTSEQPQARETLFKERPDISSLFGNNIFGDLNLTPIIPDVATDLDVDLETETDPLTKTKTKTKPKTKTKTLLQQVNPTAIDIALRDQVLPKPITQTKPRMQPVNPTPVPVDIAVMDPDPRLPRAKVPSEYVPTPAPAKNNPPMDINPPEPITTDITTPTPKTPAVKKPSAPKTLTPAAAKKKKLKESPDILADFTKGRKIKLPLESLMQIINTQPSNPIPMQNNLNPNYNPFDFEEELKAAKAGGLMRLASGGATPGSNISIGPGDASYSPVANFIKGNETKSYLPEKYDLQMFTYAPTPFNAEASLKAILAAAEGGIVHMAAGGDTENPAFDPSSAEIKMKGKRFAYNQPFTGLNMMANAPRFNDGGEVAGHNPQFFSEGGLNAMENRYVTGDGDGTSDSIPAMLANGEFVIPADVVSSLGNGSNDSGASILDEFLKTIRDHKTRAGKNGLPPDSKGALGYLLEAKRKVKA